MMMVVVGGYGSFDAVAVLVVMVEVGRSGVG